MNLKKKFAEKFAVLALAFLLGAFSANAISFDLSKSTLNYSQVSPGSFNSMPVTLYVRGDKTMVCTLTADDAIKDWIRLNESSTLLQPYTAKTVNIDLRIPQDATHQRYSQKVYLAIGEYSPSGGMGVDMVLRMPVNVYFDVLGTGSGSVYSIKNVEITGVDLKKILLKESNNGDKILLLDYEVNVYSREGLVKNASKSDKIRPYSTKSSEIELGAVNLEDGEYTVNIIVTSNGVEYANANFKFAAGVKTSEIVGISTTTTLMQNVESSTTTILSEEIPEQKTDYFKYGKYLFVLTLVLVNFFCIIYLIKRRSRKKSSI